MTTLGENITMKSYGIVHKMYDWYCDHIVEIAMVVLIVGGVAINESGKSWMLGIVGV